MWDEEDDGEDFLECFEHKFIPHNFDYNHYSDDDNEDHNDESLYRMDTETLEQEIMNNSLSNNKEIRKFETYEN